MIKIIFIAGDGRSGSTLLESVLANAAGTIGVGECHRFWSRLAEGTSLCGCGEPLSSCEFWNAVNEELKLQFPDYDPATFGEEVREFQRHRYFKQMPTLLQQPRWSRLAEMVAHFYRAIAMYSEKNTIIDSSKSVPWALLLQSLDQFDVRVIHLERKLTGVANSWKKQVRLPEYISEERWMPRKSNALILKTWLKVKLLSRKLRSAAPYIFLRFDQLCAHSETTLERIQEFAGIQLNTNKLQVQSGHGIAGNPMRFDQKGHPLEIKPSIGTKELSFFERIGFSLVDKLASFV
ncbi:MAG: sulfotransferase [Bacteroidota bacterium]